MTADNVLQIVGGPKCGTPFPDHPRDAVYLHVDGFNLPIHMTPHGPRALWAKREEVGS